MLNGKIIITFFILFTGLIFSSSAQEKIKILNANTLKYKEIKGIKVRKLIGDVKFRQKGVTMECDSAYQYEERDLIKAYNNIHIRQGDSVHLWGKFLRYSGETRKAIIKRNVILKEENMTLKTDTLYYEMDKSKAYYLNGGVIRDSANRLTSEKGFYYSKTKDFYFQDSVRLYNPDYTIYCDTLQYNASSEKAFFHGPTDIISDSNYLYCENGWYDTKRNTARFGKNSKLRSGKNILYADSLFYDRNKKYGKAWIYVKMVDTSKDLVIEGEKGEYYEGKKTSYVTDSVLARKIEKKDTFYLHADTLKSGYDSAGKRIMKAYYGAKTFNKQFQSQCDSLIYKFSDSTIYLYKGPVMWYQNYQLSGEKVRVITDGAGNAKKMIITNNAFIIAQEDSLRFNQIKGRKMTGYFKNNELKRIFVEGNAEAIYFLQDENNKYMGINKIKSGNIRIKLENREIVSINFLEQPQATVYPPKDSNPENFRFPGFKWLEEDRPENVMDLYKEFTLRSLTSKGQSQKK